MMRRSRRIGATAALVLLVAVSAKKSKHKIDKGICDETKSFILPQGASPIGSGQVCPDLYLVKEDLWHFAVDFRKGTSRFDWPGLCVCYSVTLCDADGAAAVASARLLFVRYVLCGAV